MWVVRRHARHAVVALVASLLAAVAADAPATPAGAFGFPDVDLRPSAERCLQREQVVELVGPRGRFPHRAAVPDGAAVDARRATWDAGDYPVIIRPFADQDRRALCFVGGRITHPSPHETTSWSVWHGTSGVTVESPDVQIFGTRVDNAGDGLRFTGSAHDWTVRHVHLSQVHDDCVENDGMQSGTILDSFFDGCYVFYSARGDRSADGPRDNHEVVTIRDSLVRLQAMPSVYDGRKGSGHGPLLKMSGPASMGRAPRLEIYDTVIRIDQAPAHGDLGIPAYDADGDPSTPGEPYLTPDDCARNTVVWLGEGPFPDELPSCFEITTDVDVWTRAVAEWQAEAQVRRVQDLVEQVATTPRG